MMDQSTFKRKIALKERLDDELDTQISRVFRAYCEAEGIHFAYGVYSWEECGDRLRIEQDTSAMSCFNSTMHYLPMQLAHLEGNELKAAMKEYVANKRREKREKAAAERHEQHIEDISKALASANS